MEGAGAGGELVYWKRVRINSHVVVWVPLTEDAVVGMVLFLGQTATSLFRLGGKAPEGTGIGTIVFLVSGVDQPLNTPREPEFQGRGDPREGTNPWPSQSIESRLANVDRRARLIEIHVPPSCE